MIHSDNQLTNIIWMLDNTIINNNKTECRLGMILDIQFLLNVQNLGHNNTRRSHDKWLSQVVYQRFLVKELCLSYSIFNLKYAKLRPTVAITLNVGYITPKYHMVSSLIYPVSYSHFSKMYYFQNCETQSLKWIRLEVLAYTNIHQRTIMWLNFRARFLPVPVETKSQK